MCSCAGESTRAVGYWTDGRDERIFTVTPGFRLVALDAKTGLPVQTFGQAGVVDLFKELDPVNPMSLIGTIGNSSPPVIARDTLIVGPAHAQSSGWRDCRTSAPYSAPLRPIAVKSGVEAQARLSSRISSET